MANGGATSGNVTGDLAYGLNLERIASQGTKFWATLEILSWDPLRAGTPSHHDGFANGIMFVKNHANGKVEHNSVGYLKADFGGSLKNWNIAFKGTDNEKAVILKVNNLNLIGSEDDTIYVAKMKVASWDSEEGAKNGTGTRLDDDMQVFYLMSQVDEQYYLKFSPCANLEIGAVKPWVALEADHEHRFPCAGGSANHDLSGLPDRIGVAPYCDKYHFKKLEYLEIISADWNNLNKPSVGDTFKADLNYLVEKDASAEGILPADQYVPFRECYTCDDRLTAEEFKDIREEAGLTQSDYLYVGVEGGGNTTSQNCIAINPKRSHGGSVTKFGRFSCGSRSPEGQSSMNACIGTISMDEYHISEALMNTLTSLGWGEGIGGFEATAFETTLDTLSVDPGGAGYAKTVRWKRMIGYGHTRVHRASLPGTASSYSWRGSVEYQPEDLENIPVVDNASFYWIINSTASQSYAFFDRYRQQIELEVNKVANLDGSGETLRYDIVRAWDPEHKKMFIESTFRNQASITVGGKLNEVFDVGITMSLSRSMKEGLDGEGNETSTQSTNISVRAYMTWTDLLSNAIKGDPGDDKFAWSDALSVSIDLGQAGGTFTKKWSYFVKDEDGSIRPATSQDRAFRKGPAAEARGDLNHMPVGMFKTETMFADSPWQDNLFEIQSIGVNYDIKSNNGWALGVSVSRDAEGNITKDAAVSFSSEIPMWENVKYSLDWAVGQSEPGLSLAYRSDDLIEKLTGLETPTLAGKEITLFLNVGINVNELMTNKQYMPSWSFEGTWGNPGQSILSGFRYDVNIPEGRLALSNSTQLWTHNPTETENYKAQVSWAMEASIGDPTKPFYTAPVDAAGVKIGIDAKFEKTVIEFNDMWGKVIMRANFTAGLKAGTSTVGGGGLGGGMANAGVFGICGFTWDNDVLGYLKFPVNMVPSIGPKFGWNFVLKAISTAGGTYTGASFIMLLGGVSWNMKPVDQLRIHLGRVRNPWVEDIPLLGAFLSTLPVIGAIGELESELQYLARAGTARAFAALGAAAKTCLETKKKAFLAVWQRIVAGQRGLSFDKPCCWADGVVEIWDNGKNEGDPPVLKIKIPKDFYNNSTPNNENSHRTSTATLEWARQEEKDTKKWFTGKYGDPFIKVVNQLTKAHGEIIIGENDDKLIKKYLGGDCWKLLTDETSSVYPHCRLAAGEPWRTGGAKKNEQWGGKKSKCGRWEFDKRQWNIKNPPCNCMRADFDKKCRGKHYQLHDLDSFPELDGASGYINAILETIDDFIYNRVVNNCEKAGSNKKLKQPKVKGGKGSHVVGVRGGRARGSGGRGAFTDGETNITSAEFYDVVYDACAKNVSDTNDDPALKVMRARLGEEGGCVDANAHHGCVSLQDQHDEGQYCAKPGHPANAAFGKKDDKGKLLDPGKIIRVKDPQDNAYHDYSDKEFRDALAEEIASVWHALDNDTWKHLGSSITKIGGPGTGPNDPDGSLDIAGHFDGRGDGDPRIANNDKKRELIERASDGRDDSKCQCAPPSGFWDWGLWPWNWGILTGEEKWRPPSNPDAECMKKCIKEMISHDQPYRGDLLGIVFGYLRNLIKLGKPYCCNLEPLRTDDPKATARSNCQGLYESYELWKATYELDLDRWWGLTNCPQKDDAGLCVDCLPDFDENPTIKLTGSIGHKTNNEDTGAGLCCSTRTYYKMWRYLFSLGGRVNAKIAAANSALDIIPIPHRYRDGKFYLAEGDPDEREDMPPGCTQVGLYGRDPETRELTSEGFYHQPDGEDNAWEADDHSLNPEKIKCISCPMKDEEGNDLKPKMGTLTQAGGRVGPEDTSDEGATWSPNAHDDWLSYQTELDPKGKSGAADSKPDWQGTGGRQIEGPSHYFKHDGGLCDTANDEDLVYLPSYEDNNKRCTVLKYKIKSSNEWISYVLTSPEFHVVNDFIQGDGELSPLGYESFPDPSIPNWLDTESVGKNKFKRFKRGSKKTPSTDMLDKQVAPHWMWELEGGAGEHPPFDNLSEAAQAWSTVVSHLNWIAEDFKGTSPAHGSDSAKIGETFGWALDLAYDFYKRINNSTTKSTPPDYPEAKRFTALLKSDENKASYWADATLGTLKYDAEMLIEAHRRMYLVWLSYWWGAARQKDITNNASFAGSQGGMGGGASYEGGWYIYKMMDGPWNAGARLAGDTSAYSGASFPFDSRYWLYVQENGMTNWALTGTARAPQGGHTAAQEKHARDMAGFFGWDNRTPANGGQPKGGVGDGAAPGGLSWNDDIYNSSNNTDAGLLSERGCCPWGTAGGSNCKTYHAAALPVYGGHKYVVANDTPVTNRVRYDGDLLHCWNPVMSDNIAANADGTPATLTTSMIGTKANNEIGTTYELATEGLEMSWRLSPSHTHGRICKGKDTPLGRYNLAPFGWKLCGMFGSANGAKFPNTLLRVLKRHLIPYFGKRLTPNTASDTASDCGHGAGSTPCASDASPFRIPITFILKGGVDNLASFYTNTAQGWNIEQDMETVKLIQQKGMFVPETNPAFGNAGSESRKRLQRLRVFINTLMAESCNNDQTSTFRGLDLFAQLFSNNSFGLGQGPTNSHDLNDGIIDSDTGEAWGFTFDRPLGESNTIPMTPQFIKHYQEGGSGAGDSTLSDKGLGGVYSGHIYSGGVQTTRYWNGSGCSTKAEKPWTSCITGEFTPFFTCGCSPLRLYDNAPNSGRRDLFWYTTNSVVGRKYWLPWAGKYYRQWNKMKALAVIGAPLQHKSESTGGARAAGFHAKHRHCNCLFYAADYSSRLSNSTWVIMAYKFMKIGHRPLFYPTTCYADRVYGPMHDDNPWEGGLSLGGGESQCGTKKVQNDNCKHTATDSHGNVTSGADWGGGGIPRDGGQRDKSGKRWLQTSRRAPCGGPHLGHAVVNNSTCKCPK